MKTTNIKNSYSFDLSEKQRIAFRMRAQGYENLAIADAVGVKPNALSDWYSRPEIKEIESHGHGFPLGSGRSFSPEQEIQIQRLLASNIPKDLGLPDVLWTRHSMVSLIQRHCHVTLPLSTAGLYLQRWGFTAPKPANQTYKRQSEAVKHWLDENYPALEARAKSEDATIHWGNDTNTHHQDPHRRNQAPLGQAPVKKLFDDGQVKLSLNMISSVSDQGTTRFMLYEKQLTTTVVIRFLERLVQGVDKKVFLMLDSLKVYQPKRIKAWAACHSGQIELFFLPTYPPGLNPDEYLTGGLRAKTGINGRASFYPSRSGAF